MLNGHLARQEREWFRTATLAAWTMAPWVKKGVKPRQLLGREFMAAMRRRQGHAPDPDTEDED